MDSGFGNAGLWKPVRRAFGERFQLSSRLCSNHVLFALPDTKQPGQRGRPRKYGHAWERKRKAARLKLLATAYHVDFYGKRREVSAYIPRLSC